MRQPHLRQELLALAAHRYKVPSAITRQLLAPRSIFLAGFFAAALMAASCLVPRVRHQMFATLERPKCLLAAFIMLQAVLSIATATNLYAFIGRTFGKPPWRTQTHEVLTYALPQAYPDSQKLKASLPAQTALALQPGSELVYMLASLAYPLRVYDAYPKSGLTWKNDPDFAGFARRKQIDYLLRYEPFDRTNPLVLERIR